MSKTRQEIFNEMLVEKGNLLSLSNLTSTSNTAIWRVWLWLVAFAHELLYAAWDKEKDALSSVASQQIIGTAPWYQGLCLNWSAGSAQIAAVWATEAITALDKKVLVKVANKTTGPNPRYASLSNADLLALSNYIHTKKILGTDVNVMSQIADQLQFSFDIKYVGSKAAVEALIADHIKQYLAAIPFGATLSLAQLTNSLYAVLGVVDVVMHDALLNEGVGFNSVLIANYIKPNAGYWELGVDSNNNDLLQLNMYQ
jgi:hypothetical protein